MEVKYWIALFVTIGLFSLGIVGSMLEDKSLRDCSKITKAVVVDFYQIKSRGYFVRYNYIIDSISLEKTVSLPEKIKVDQIKIGDSIDVIYSCSNWNYSDFKPIN